MQECTPMANLTIKDIARMAGVSTTAVSFVLNDRPGVSDATRKKVQEIIRQTDFIPNVHTRRLNLGKSFTIHVVLKQYNYGLFNQFALETLSGIFKEGKSLGYSIIFTLVDEHMDCDQIIDSVRSKDCDGVILNQIADPGLISQLQKENIPFVCVDAHLPEDSSLPWWKWITMMPLIRQPGICTSTVIAKSVSSAPRPLWNIAPRLSPVLRPI